MIFKHIRNTHKQSYFLLFLQSWSSLHPPLIYHIQHLIAITVPPISNGNTLIEVSCLFPNLDTRNEAEDRPTIPLRGEPCSRGRDFCQVSDHIEVWLNLQGRSTANAEMCNSIFERQWRESSSFLVH